jgi:hypothetical protein
MVDAYKVVAEYSEFTDSEDGQTGVLRLIGPVTSGVGTMALPAIGAAFSALGTTAAACLLRSRNRKVFERDGAYYQYTLNYSTKSNPNPTPVDTTERKQSFGGDMQTIEKPDAWKWTTSGSAIMLPMPVRIVTVTFSRPTKELAASANESFKAAMVANGGKINSDEYDGWGVGNVMLVGANGGSARNKAGTQVWKYEVEFAVRIVPGKATDGWQYIMREDGIWDKPKRKDNATYLYETAAFGTTMNGFFA